MKKYSIEELQDKYIGKTGTKKRDQFEFKLNLNLVEDMVKTDRKKLK